jgi:branched-chain amino acid transport system ATP-binding protein
LQENFRIIRRINERGITIFLVEQNVHQTLAISDYGYVLSKGHVVVEGNPEQLSKTKEVHQAYFG